MRVDRARRHVTLDACAVDSAHNGIWLQDTGSALMLRNTFVDARLWAVYASDGAALDLSGCTVTSREQNGLLQLRRPGHGPSSLIEDCGLYGCAASGGNTRLELCEVPPLQGGRPHRRGREVVLSGCVVHDNQDQRSLRQPGYRAAAGTLHDLPQRDGRRLDQRGRRVRRASRAA